MVLIRSKIILATLPIDSHDSHTTLLDSIHSRAPSFPSLSCVHLYWEGPPVVIHSPSPPPSPPMRDRGGRRRGGGRWEGGGRRGGGRWELGGRRSREITVARYLLLLIYRQSLTLSPPRDLIKHNNQLPIIRLHFAWIATAYVIPISMKVLHRPNMASPFSRWEIHHFLRALPIIFVLVNYPFHLSSLHGKREREKERGGISNGRIVLTETLFRLFSRYAHANVLAVGGDRDGEIEWEFPRFIHASHVSVATAPLIPLPSNLPRGSTYLVSDIS